MRVLGVADEVSEHLWTSDVVRYRAELIVACGDVPFELLGWMGGVTGAPVLFVPGNHDPDLS
ncbi:MAG TPA: hypothetical protein VGL49_03000, partial [Acidimicrobiales bacterium]